MSELSARMEEIKKFMVIADNYEQLLSDAAGLLKEVDDDGCIELREYREQLAAWLRRYEELK